MSKLRIITDVNLDGVDSDVVELLKSGKLPKEGEADISEAQIAEYIFERWDDDPSVRVEKAKAMSTRVKAARLVQSAGRTESMVVGPDVIPEGEQGFTITGHKGFRMAFSSGYEISVQWGFGNYRDGREMGTFNSERFHDYFSSPNAEVAVFNPSGNMVQIQECDQVAGWVSPDAVGKLIGYLAEGGTDLERMQKLAEGS
jgi:hypothetical protein